jgi:hypothetical protein
LVSARIVVGLVSLIALVAFVLPGLYVGVRSIQADVVAVVERRNGMAAMQRSFDVTQGELWRYLGLATATVGLITFINLLLNECVVQFSQLDHWLVSAALSLVIDLMAAWASLVFVVAYRVSLHRKEMRPGASSGQE